MHCSPAQSALRDLDHCTWRLPSFTSQQFPPALHNLISVGTLLLLLPLPAGRLITPAINASQAAAANMQLGKYMQHLRAVLNQRHQHGPGVSLDRGNVGRMAVLTCLRLRSTCTSLCTRSPEQDCQMRMDPSDTHNKPYRPSAASNCHNNAHRAADDTQLLPGRLVGMTHHTYWLDSQRTSSCATISMAQTRHKHHKRCAAVKEHASRQRSLVQVSPARWL